MRTRTLLAPSVSTTAKLSAMVLEAKKPPSIHVREPLAPARNADRPATWSTPADSCAKSDRYCASPSSRPPRPEEANIW